MASEWQPIATAPKDGTSVLVFTLRKRGRNQVVKLAWFHRGMNASARGYWWSDQGGVCYPTHWMPLPAPPVEVGKS